MGNWIPRYVKKIEIPPHLCFILSCYFSSFARHFLIYITLPSRRVDEKSISKLTSALKTDYLRGWKTVLAVEEAIAKLYVRQAR